MHFTETLKKLGLILLLLVVFCPPSQAADDAEYEALVEQSLSMPDGYDFARLRELFQKLPDYSPYSLIPEIDFKAITDIKDSEPAKAEAMMQDFGKKYFAVTEGHSRMMVYYKDKGDLDKTAYHEWMFRGLYGVLLKSGDGKSAETAYKVVSVSEEYLLARRIMDKKEQSLKHIEGRVYDVLSGPSNETGETVEMWFDITELFGKGI